MHPPLYDLSAVSSRGQQGTIETLPNGRKKARYWTGGRGSTRKSKTFDTRQQAAEWLRDRLDELDAARNGSTAVQVRQREAARTVAQACDAFLGAHEAEPPTIAKLRAELRQLCNKFGERPLRSVEQYELQAWRKTLSPGARHNVTRATKQMYAQCVDWGWLHADESPAARLKNPRPNRPEVKPPPWESVLAISDEIDQRYEGLPEFAAGTGLRPEEWVALERADFDYEARVVRVRRVYSQAIWTELGADGRKTRLQRRDVPLRQVVLDALARRHEKLPTRIDTPLMFPAPRGGPINIDRWRQRDWLAACRAAGLAHRVPTRSKEAHRPSRGFGWRAEFRPKDLRHVYASESIAAGVDLFTLSRRMGTSLKEIDETYGHLVHGAVDRELGLLNAWDVAQGRLAEEAR
jgi:integrase